AEPQEETASQRFIQNPKLFCETVRYEKGNPLQLNRRFTKCDGAEVFWYHDPRSQTPPELDLFYTSSGGSHPNGVDTQNFLVRVGFLRNDKSSDVCQRVQEGLLPNTQEKWSYQRVDKFNFSMPKGSYANSPMLPGENLEEQYQVFCKW